MAEELPFGRLNSTKFENFCFDLLEALGFKSVEWRKGTDKRASPSDRGRDIVCKELRVERDESIEMLTWFVECKHFKRGVPATELQNLLSWAHAKRPDVALFIVSGFLSNSAKDYLEDYRRNQRPPFKIRVWERPQIEKLVRKKRILLRRYGLLDAPIRTVKAILQAESEFFDKVWYDRHQQFMERVRTGKDETPNDIVKTARAAAKSVRTRYGKGELGPWTDFEWGMLNGKLSALRWVLGDEWDFLDT